MIINNFTIHLPQSFLTAFKIIFSVVCPTDTEKKNHFTLITLTYVRWGLIDETYAVTEMVVIYHNVGLKFINVDVYLFFTMDNALTTLQQARLCASY